MSLWGVVVPSIRPGGFSEFLRAWTPLFEKHNVRLYVVWDLEDPPARDVGEYPFAEWCWRGIPDFIPRQTDMIRSWGFYRAWLDDCEYILSLDDDVRPAGDIFERYEEEFVKPHALSPYLDVGALTRTGLKMRGFPYNGRKATVAVQYGGWRGVPDLDAVTQLHHPLRSSRFDDIVLPVPVGAPVTTCAMNFAFKAQFTPLMWQLPLYERRYNRFGDIWSGLIQKKILDNLGYVMLVNGKASVQHQRASDPYQNLRREAPGMKLNEDMWDNICSYASVARTPLGHFHEVTNNIAWAIRPDDPKYADHFIRARNEWQALFS